MVIIDRITAEHRTGRMSADTVFATAEPMKFINKEKGLLDRYVSPSAKDYSKPLVDGFFGPNYRSGIIVFLYNKDMIKPGSAQVLRGYRQSEVERHSSQKEYRQTKLNQAPLLIVLPSLPCVMSARSTPASSPRERLLPQT